MHGRAPPDNAPLLGRVGAADGAVRGLIIATGFFRHGVLLTPMAAQIVAGLLDGSADDRWVRFRPDRFSARRPRPSPHSNTIHRFHQGNSMNITLNGARHTVADGASVSTLVTSVTGRALDPSGQAADGGKLGVAVARNAGGGPA